jgi:hypothetical protein
VPQMLRPKPRMVLVETYQRRGPRVQSWDEGYIPRHLRHQSSQDTVGVDVGTSHSSEISPAGDLSNQIPGTEKLQSVASHVKFFPKVGGSFDTFLGESGATSVGGDSAVLSFQTAETLRSSLEAVQQFY